MDKQTERQTEGQTDIVQRLTRLPKKSAFPFTGF